MRNSEIRLGNIDWKPTVKLNFFRCVAGSLVWSIVTLISALVGATEAAQVFAFLLVPVIFPLYLGMAVFLQWLANRGVPFVGWLAFFAALLPMAGDPILAYLQRTRPGFLEVESYPVFHRAPVLFVLKPAALAAGASPAGIVNRFAGG